MWTLTGLVMVAKPIEEVRGDHLRLEQSERVLPAGPGISVALPETGSRPVRSIATTMGRDEPVTRVDYADGTVERFSADGAPLGSLDEEQARSLVAERIRGGEAVERATLFAADEVPFDFRRPMPVWQVALEDGTHIYVGADTGEIEAVRTRWWRLFDVMWGLHIMDLQTREDSSHPILILFATLALAGSLLGCILLFRRRKTRVTA